MLLNLLQCEILGDLLYQADWYKLEKELQKDLMLIIQKSRQPIFITAGPFGNMTFQMMVTVRYNFSEIS